MKHYRTGYCDNTIDMDLLNIQDIIEILSDEEIIFKAEIGDQGQDTYFDCIEFRLLNKKLYDFYFYLDLYAHGHTVQGGKEMWFYSPRTREEFLELLKTGHIKNK